MSRSPVHSEAEPAGSIIELVQFYTFIRLPVDVRCSVPFHWMKNLKNGNRLPNLPFSRKHSARKRSCKQISARVFRAVLCADTGAKKPYPVKELIA